MKKILLLAPLLCALTASAFAETRTVGAFSSVDAQGNFRVEVVQGAANAVDVSGPDAQRVVARVNGDRLVLSPADRPWFGREPELNAIVRVSAPRLDGLRSSRGAQVAARGLDAPDLNIDASMGGVITLAGHCGSLQAAASMGGVLDAQALACGQVHASASMGGVVNVNAHDGVTASASMGGVIDVSGNPAQRSQRSAMGGEIRYD